MDWAAFGGNMRRRFSAPPSSQLSHLVTEGSERLLAVRSGACGGRRRPHAAGR